MLTFDRHATAATTVIESSSFDEKGVLPIQKRQSCTMHVTDKSRCQYLLQTWLFHRPCRPATDLQEACWFLQTCNRSPVTHCTRHQHLLQAQNRTVQTCTGLTRRRACTEHVAVISVSACYRTVETCMGLTRSILQKGGIYWLFTAAVTIFVLE